MWSCVVRGHQQLGERGTANRLTRIGVVVMLMIVIQALCLVNHRLLQLTNLAWLTIAVAFDFDEIQTSKCLYR